MSHVTQRHNKEPLGKGGEEPDYLWEGSYSTVGLSVAT